jgi:riboflavin biosynthesis pyrimidine reductase
MEACLRTEGGAKAMENQDLIAGVDQLYPQHEQGLELRGLYLKQDLRHELNAVQAPFIYANFITSLDGRIAVPQEEAGEVGVPPQTANRRDWRLFQELAVQADLVISSGRYLRDYAAGEAQEILQVYDDPAFADLKDWRANQGLAPYPDLAIVSRSLDFPLSKCLLESDRSLVVITTEESDAARKQELEALSIVVLECGVQNVEGEKMAAALHNLGYDMIYSAAGPHIAHMLVASGVLNRLYLTFALRLLAGTDFATIIAGSGFNPAPDVRLRTLYFDQHAPGSTGQLFAAFDCPVR